MVFINTLFDYLYRDGSNYKKWGSIVFAGELTDSFRRRFVAALQSGEFFIAEQIRVPEVFPDTWPMYADDHCWHEWAGFESIESQPTDPFRRSIEQFVREVEEAVVSGWQDFDPQRGHRHTSRGILGHVDNGDNDRKVESTGMRRSVVHTDPEIMGGEPVFVGTRVPVRNLFDCLEAGDSIDDFIRSFPSVTKEQAVAALEIGKEAVEAIEHSR